MFSALMRQLRLRADAQEIQGSPPHSLGARCQISLQKGQEILLAQTQPQTAVLHSHIISDALHDHVHKM